MVYNSPSGMNFSGQINCMDAILKVLDINSLYYLDSVWKCIISPKVEIFNFLGVQTVGSWWTGIKFRFLDWEYTWGTGIQIEAKGYARL